MTSWGTFCGTLAELTSVAVQLGPARLLMARSTSPLTLAFACNGPALGSNLFRRCSFTPWNLLLACNATALGSTHFGGFRSHPGLCASLARSVCYTTALGSTYFGGFRFHVVVPARFVMALPSAQLIWAVFVHMPARFIVAPPSDQLMPAAFVLSTRILKGILWSWLVVQPLST